MKIETNDGESTQSDKGNFIFKNLLVTAFVISFYCWSRTVNDMFVSVSIKTVSVTSKVTENLRCKSVLIWGNAQSIVEWSMLCIVYCVYYVMINFGRIDGMGVVSLSIWEVMDML